MLDTLAAAPRRLCDARTSVAFLLANVVDAHEHVRTTDPSITLSGAPLGDELLIQVLRTTRKEILRDHIAVEPQYSNIKDECYAGFDRLRADPGLIVMTLLAGISVTLAAEPRPDESSPFALRLWCDASYALYLDHCLQQLAAPSLPENKR